MTSNKHLANLIFNTFRFDMSGTGERSGDFVNSFLRKQASDLNAAIRFLSNLYPTHSLGLVGFSLGATAALYIQNPKISAYSFWSPALFPAKDMFPRYDTPENRAQLEDKGYILKNGLVVGKKMIEDLRRDDSVKSLSSLVRPVQIIHGTEDPRIDHRSSIKANEQLKCDHELVLIDGANHSYKGDDAHRQEVFEKTTEWFSKHL